MKNCVVTKLKASVSNDDLLILGKVIIECANTTPFKLEGTSGKVQVLNGQVYNKQTASGAPVSEFNLSTNNPFVTPATNGIRLLVDKYHITRIIDTLNQMSFNTLNFNIDAFDCECDLTELSLMSASSHLNGNVDKVVSTHTLDKLKLRSNSANLDNIILTNMLELSLRNSNNKGTIEGKTFPLLQQLDLRGSSQIVGDIDKATFGNNLNQLSLRECGISGDLKTMADNLWNNGNGKTSGSILVSVDNASLVRWDGQTIFSVIGANDAHINFSENAPTLTA